MKELREGMFFQVKKNKGYSDAMLLTTDKECIYTATYLNKDYNTFIPNNILSEAYDRNLYVLYTNNDFILAPPNFEPIPLLPEIINLDFLNDCYKHKPKTLFMSELKWKVLIRNLLKGKNVMLTGHAGTGKTVAARTAAKALRRPFFIFRVGAMQDPRSSLIGNTFYSKEKGTYFKPSDFIKAIQTPYAVIALDELSRAHPEAHNILLSVLDPEQKCISLDESDNDEGNVIHVAEGVSFVATANIGTEYTGTRQIDRANIDRFQYIEIDLLSEDEEFQLTQLIFPECDANLLSILCKISADVKKEYLSDNPNISNMMSTRMVLEAAEFIDDGFTIGEALEATIIPLFDAKGGASSERTYLTSIIGKIAPLSKRNLKKAKTTFTDADLSAKNPFNKKK
jgi:hypothetical protein